MASEIGYDDGVWSLPDGVLNPLGPIEVGGATYRLVGGNGYASLQEAIDAASDGEILLVAPGSYTEGRQFTADEIGLPGYGQNHYGLLINKSVTIQGVSANGAPIGDVADVAATIVARYQAGYETSFAVTAQDVTIRGLGFVPTNEKFNPAQATDRINKAFEIYGDGFTLEHSTIEQQGELPTSSAIFFNGEGSTENVNTATVAGNVIYGSITLVNGAGGDGDPATSIVIADNVIVGDLLPAIRLNGDIAGVQWLQADVGLPVLTGNTIQFGVEGVSLVVYSGNLAQEGDSVTLEELDAYVAAVMAANDGIGAAVKDASGHVQITPLSNLTSVGDSGLGVAIYGSLQDAIDAAEEGDVIELAGGTYVEDVIVAKSGLTVRAAEGAEVTLQGGFFVNGSGAEGFTFALEGLTIERGLETTDFGNTARFKGLYIKGDADVTVDGVELVAGTGYSGVMADQYRGIEVEAGSAASVTVLDSEFVNWKTGIYLNAGASLSVEGSAFSGNVAGIGTDGPAALSVTNSTFADQTSEAIGFTPGKSVGALTLSGLEVTGSPVANVALGDAEFEGAGCIT